VSGDDTRRGRMTGLGGLLREMLGPQTAGAMTCSQVANRWSEIVGDTLAQHCRPVAVQPPRLVIEVTSPTWHTTLRTMQPRLLKAIDHRFPELGITELRMQLGRPPAVAKQANPADELPSPAELEAMPLTLAVEDQIRRVVAGIEDDAVRERVAEAMRAQKRLMQWRLAHGWRLDRRTGQLLPPVGPPR